VWVDRRPHETARLVFARAEIVFLCVAFQP
jgi:hypothetical protein